MTNSTHWTMVAACAGCTSWQNVDGNQQVLNGTGSTQFAWAQGTSAIQTPSSNTSAFNVHNAIGKWTHDLNAARSPNFSSWVSSNMMTAATGGTGATTGVGAASSAVPTTLSTAVTSAKPSATINAKIPSSCPSAGSPKFSSVLASGWKATKVLGGLTSPRSMVFDSAGNMLIVQSGKGVTVHAMNADGCITSSKTLVAMNGLNHGITLSLDGKTLYASTMTTVFSWPYDATAMTVGTRATIITGMYNGGSHVTRTLLQAPHKANLLLVAHGTNDNWDYAAGNPKTGRAIIKVFDTTKIPSAGYNYPNDGWLAGYGMRNEVGMTFDNNNMSVSLLNSCPQ